jgi:hypothetical protein
MEIYKKLIPDLQKIIDTYIYPDYKKHYDFVLKDLSWISGDIASEKLGMINNYENWLESINMIQKSSNIRFQEVLHMLDTTSYNDLDCRFLTKPVIKKMSQYDSRLTEWAVQLSYHQRHCRVIDAFLNKILRYRHWN